MYFFRPFFKLGYICLYKKVNFCLANCMQMRKEQSVTANSWTVSALKVHLFFYCPWKGTTRNDRTYWSDVSVSHMPNNVKSFCSFHRILRQCCLSPSTQGSFCTLWFMHVLQLCCCASLLPLSLTLSITGKNSILSIY